jgi:hypothetical protein
MAGQPALAHLQERRYRCFRVQAGTRLACVRSPRGAPNRRPRISSVLRCAARRSGGSDSSEGAVGLLEVTGLLAFFPLTDPLGCRHHSRNRCPRKSFSLRLSPRHLASSSENHHGCPGGKTRPTHSADACRTSQPGGSGLSRPGALPQERWRPPTAPTGAHVRAWRGIPGSRHNQRCSGRAGSTRSRSRSRYGTIGSPTFGRVRRSRRGVLRFIP